MMAANNYTVDIRLGYPRIMDETDKFIYNAFVAGAEWQKEQMLKGAVEGFVSQDELIVRGAKKLKNGDKVRIVVIKADEE